MVSLALMCPLEMKSCQPEESLMLKNNQRVTLKRFSRICGSSRGIPSQKFSGPQSENINVVILMADGVQLGMAVYQDLPKKTYLFQQS